MHARRGRRSRRGLASIVVATSLCCAAAACSTSSSRDRTSPTSSNRHSKRGEVTVSGRARLDGRPFDARFIGAVVVDDNHLVTPCNVTIPTIIAGRFSLGVYAASASAGCGRHGAKVVLWTYVGSQKLFATTPINWATADTGDLSVDFSTAQPLGATRRVFELNGGVFHADGSRVRTGARVEAFIGTTLCGVASVRTGVFDGYILHVVGPDSIPACASGGRITFRVDGVRARESIANGGTPPRTFDLTA